MSARPAAQVTGSEGDDVGSPQGQYLVANQQYSGGGGGYGRNHQYQSEGDQRYSEANQQYQPYGHQQYGAAENEQSHSGEQLYQPSSTYPQPASKSYSSPLSPPINGLDFASDARASHPPATSNSQAPTRNLPAPPMSLPGSGAIPGATSKKHQRLMSETDEELTEDERIEYESGIVTWGKIKNWRYWLRKEWWYWYLILVLLVLVVALMVFFHKDIINWLTPFTKKLRALNAGFLIPAAIIIVLSFPPLFGNEIVMILTGVVWGLGKGFAIVAVGTIIGELLNFLAFRYCCKARGQRMTKKNLNYACLSQAIIEGGFVMAFVVRLSVIPTHFTTAVFAVCGLPIYHFVIALVLGLPKQLITVYVGDVLGQTNATTNSHVISDCVFGATAVITLGALWFIYHRMLGVRKKVILGMRDDLRSKNVRVSDPPSTGDFNQADNDGGSWDNPWAREAITGPRQPSMGANQGAGYKQ